MNRKLYKRYHSSVITAEREKVEADLSAINPLSPEARNFHLFNGFAEMYLRMRDLYPTQFEAYEQLEDFYITLTGKHRYSEFSLFRRWLNRIRNILNLRSKFAIGKRPVSGAIFYGIAQ